MNLTSDQRLKPNRPKPIEECLNGFVGFICPEPMQPRLTWALPTVVQFAVQCAVQCGRLEVVFLFVVGAPSLRFCCSRLVKKVSEGPEINFVTIACDHCDVWFHYNYQKTERAPKKNLQCSNCILKDIC